MGMRAAFSHPPFRVFWSAQVAARAGESIQEIALIWLVYETTGDAAILALLVAVTTLPTVLSSLPAGSLVDTMNRKWLLVGSNFGRAGLIVLIPIVRMTESVVTIVLAVAVITGIIQAIATPARGAITPHLVPRRSLDAANALLVVTQSASRFLYVLGGIAITYLGVFSVFYLAACGFLLATGLLVRIPSGLGRPSETSHLDRSSVWTGYFERMKRGIRFVRTHEILPSVVVLSVLTTIALAPLAVVLPFYITNVTGGGSTEFGILYSSIYLGIFMGAILVGRFDALTNAFRGLIVLAGVFFIGITLLAVAIIPSHTPNPLLAGIMGFFAFGIAFTLVNTPLQTLVQSIVPSQQLGIVFAVLATLTLPAMPIAAILTGHILQFLSPSTMLLGQGILLVFTAVPLALGPLRNTGSALNF